MGKIICLFLKRIFDLVFGAMIIILFLPWMLLVSLFIKLDSKGPVFFAHDRIGFQSRKFKCWKFRTMHTGAEEKLNWLLLSNEEIKAEYERNCKLRDDPRVTRVGRFLRKTSIDELPQLWNVLKGEMSIVGPRPITEQELTRYGDGVKIYWQMKPGITGLWQVSGRSDTDYQERVRLDCCYARTWSLWLDVVIIFRTIGVVLSCRGAY